MIVVTIDSILNVLLTSWVEDLSLPPNIDNSTDLLLNVK
jgi:hypothetical protein